MSGLVEWAQDYVIKPGGFWRNLPDEDPPPLDYDIYDDSGATDEERMLAWRLMVQAFNDRNDGYADILGKVVAAALARARGDTP